MVTAKVVCHRKTITGAGEHRQAVVEFQADNSERNKEWAIYTPSLQLSMTLRGDVADLFEPGRAYELRFVEQVD